MDFQLSIHAQEELVERNIPLQVLELVLNQPEQIVEEDNLKVYQGRFEAANGKTYINFIKHCYKCTPLTPLAKGGTGKLFVANI